MARPLQILTFAALVLGFALPAGAMPVAGETKQECKDKADKCVRNCMGNDTPTERANCLKTCPDGNLCTDTATPGGVLQLEPPSGKPPKVFVPKGPKPKTLAP